VANGKHRKQYIYQLEREDGIIVGDEQLKSYITYYYKGLFGPSKTIPSPCRKISPMTSHKLVQHRVIF